MSDVSTCISSRRGQLDGKSILFLSNRNVPLGSGNVWSMPAVENGIAQARPILTEQTLFRARPDVSIDGKRFIYSSTSGAADQFNHLYVLPVEGGAPYKMTFGDHDDFHPRWSPDGERIAYISNEGGLPSLVVMETYGGGKRRIALRSEELEDADGGCSIWRSSTKPAAMSPLACKASPLDGKVLCARLTRIRESACKGSTSSTRLATRFSGFPKDR